MHWSEIPRHKLHIICNFFDMPPETVGIEYQPLPFFKQGGLLKMIQGDGSFFAGVATGNGQIKDSVIVPFTGLGCDLREAARLAELDLATEQLALEWCRFFNRYVSNQQQSFSFLDDIAGMSIDADEPFDFQPPQCWRDPATTETFRVKALVQYHVYLFVAWYVIEQNGEVYMTDDQHIGVVKAIY